MIYLTVTVLKLSQEVRIQYDYGAVKHLIKNFNCDSKIFVFDEVVFTVMTFYFDVDRRHYQCFITSTYIERFIQLGKHVKIAINISITGAFG